MDDRTLRIARQSIRVGLGLSGVAMVVAAFGGFRRSLGAVLQEVIDVAVIFNALRTSAEPRPRRVPPEAVLGRRPPTQRDNALGALRVSTIRT